MPQDEGVKDGQPGADGQPKDGQPADGGQPKDGQPKDGQQRGQHQEPKPGQKDGDGDAGKRERGLTTDLQRERAARKKLEGQIADLTTRLDLETKRVRGLAGVETKSEDEAEAEEILTRLKQIVPGFDMLLDDKKRGALDKLLQLLPALERTQQHYWGRHGLDSLKAIEKKIGETFGELTDRQITRIRAAFVTEAETNPEFAKRYEEDPEGLVEEFATQWVEDWFETSKRKVTADEVARQRKVPGARGTAPITGPDNKPIDVTNDKAVEDFLVAGAKARGVEFGRGR